MDCVKGAKHNSVDNVQVKKEQNAHLASTHSHLIAKLLPVQYRIALIQLFSMDRSVPVRKAFIGMFNLIVKIVL